MIALGRFSANRNVTTKGRCFMNVFKKIQLICVAVSMVLAGFSGCAVFNVSDFGDIPPEFSEIEACFLRDKEDILIIADYMICSGYEDLYINEKGETAWADFADIAIEDKFVSCAVKRLESNDYAYINKVDNTIKFCLWVGLRDVSCGVAYSINGIDEPQLQYMVELKPLSEPGWYYYVTNYNQWRAENAVQNN